MLQMMDELKFHPKDIMQGRRSWSLSSRKQFARKRWYSVNSVLVCWFDVHQHKEPCDMISGNEFYKTLIQSIHRPKFVCMVSVVSVVVKVDTEARRYNNG